MTYEPARPRYTLPLAGKEHELIGTFELIEAVEHAMQEGIVQVAMRVMDMGVVDTAKLLAAMITASGAKATPREMGRVLFEEVGMSGDEYLTLKIRLNAFLNILLAPPRDREEKARAVGEAIGKWEEARPASPGPTTSDSA